jgi:hypothetical protein
MGTAITAEFHNDGLIAVRAHEAEPAERQRTFRLGERVLHAKFGTGNVTGVDGKGRLVVDFDRIGEKRVVPDFLTGSADVIAFPRHRIIREVRHGKPVVLR